MRCWNELLLLLFAGDNYITYISKNLKFCNFQNTHNSQRR